MGWERRRMYSSQSIPIPHLLLRIEDKFEAVYKREVRELSWCVFPRERIIHLYLGR